MANDDDSTLDRNGNVSPWFGKLAMLAAEASGMKVGEARVRLLAQDLRQFSRPAVTRAFERARREGSGFFPTAAELTRYISASVDDRAVMAWDALGRAAADVGGYRALAVEDAAAAEALLAVFGSWPEFCAEEKGPELLVKRQAFLARYRDAVRTQSPQAQPAVLPGALPSAVGDVGHVALDGRVSLRPDRLLQGAQDVKRLTEGSGE